MNERKFLEKIIVEAGAAVMKRYGKVHTTYSKENIVDIVTEADLQSNKLLVNAIKKYFPKHGIISEEDLAFEPTRDYVWIIDPLDGTSNFASRTPLFAVILGLSYKGKMILSGIYDPVHKELFVAEKGKGVYRNGKKVSCSNKKDWKYSYGCLSASWTKKRILFLKNLTTFAQKKTFWASAHGSAGISAIYLADGRRDWYYGAGSDVWDYAASSLILEESGCKVTNKFGEPWTIKDDNIVAANKHLHKILLKIVK